MRERQKAGDTILYSTNGQMCLDTPYSAILPDPRRRAALAEAIQGLVRRMR